MRIGADGDLDLEAVADADVGAVLEAGHGGAQPRAVEACRGGVVAPGHALHDALGVERDRAGQGGGAHGLADGAVLERPAEHRRVVERLHAERTQVDAGVEVLVVVRGLVEDAEVGIVERHHVRVRRLAAVHACAGREGLRVVVARVQAQVVALAEVRAVLAGGVGEEGPRLVAPSIAAPPAKGGAVHYRPTEGGHALERRRGLPGELRRHERLAAQALRPLRRRVAGLVADVDPEAPAAELGHRALVDLDCRGALVLLGGDGPARAAVVTHQQVAAARVVAVAPVHGVQQQRARAGPVAHLDAVRRAEEADAVPVRVEHLVGDVDGIAPGQTVVVAVLHLHARRAAHRIAADAALDVGGGAEQHDAPGDLVDDGHRVADLAGAVIGDAVELRPGLAVVGAALGDDVDVAEVARVVDTALGDGEQRPVGGADDGRDADAGVGAAARSDVDATAEDGHARRDLGHLRRADRLAPQRHAIDLAEQRRGPARARAHAQHAGSADGLAGGRIGRAGHHGAIEHHPHLVGITVAGGDDPVPAPIGDARLVERQHRRGLGPVGGQGQDKATADDGEREALIAPEQQGLASLAVLAVRIGAEADLEGQRLVGGEIGEAGHRRVLDDDRCAIAGERGAGDRQRMTLHEDQAGRRGAVDPLSAAVRDGALGRGDRRADGAVELEPPVGRLSRLPTAASRAASPRAARCRAGTARRSRRTRATACGRLIVATRAERNARQEQHAEAERRGTHGEATHCTRLRARLDGVSLRREASRVAACTATQALSRRTRARVRVRARARARARVRVRVRVRVRSRLPPSSLGSPHSGPSAASRSSLKSHRVRARTRGHHRGQAGGDWGSQPSRLGCVKFHPRFTSTSGTGNPTRPPRRGPRRSFVKFLEDPMRKAPRRPKYAPPDQDRQDGREGTRT
ncbi:MAG: hypothetical protein WKG00_00725 [Polyangiaceae bacterium]